MLNDLSFEDKSFDLVITSEVLKYELEPDAAFAEISRVLKRGGVHIFSLPNAWPLPAESVSKAAIVNGEISHISPPRFQRLADGTPKLIATEFGEDLIDKLRKHGFLTQIVRRSLPLDVCYQNATYVSRKLD